MVMSLVAFALHPGSVITNFTELIKHAFSHLKMEKILKHSTLMGLKKGIDFNMEHRISFVLLHLRKTEDLDYKYLTIFKKAKVAQLIHLKIVSYLRPKISQLKLLNSGLFQMKSFKTQQ